MALIEWSSDGAAGVDAGLELAVFHDRDTVDENESDSFGILCGILKR